MGRLYNPPLSQLMFETNLIGTLVVKIIYKLFTFVDRNLSTSHVTFFHVTGTLIGELWFAMLSKLLRCLFKRAQNFFQRLR